MSTEVDSPIKSVSLITISVSNQEEAIKYYTDTLGFKVTTDAAYGEGMRWVEVAPPGSSVTLSLFQPFKADQPSPGSADNVHFKTENIDQAFAELSARGVAFEGPVMRMGDGVPPMAFFRDPDGNRFMMVEEH
jgi:catechol 2,3-dioxygenase-like lactoylglutathione lyase family enzyme